MMRAVRESWFWSTVLAALGYALALALFGLACWAVGLIWTPDPVLAQPPAPGYWGPTSGVPADYPNFGWNPQHPPVNWSVVRSWWAQSESVARTMVVNGTGNPAELDPYLDRWAIRSVVPTAEGVRYTLEEIVGAVGRSPFPLFVVPAAVVSPSMMRPGCCPVGVPWWQMPVGCVPCTTG